MEPVVGQRPTVVERVTTPRGELCLRRVGDDLEIISNGVFLMSTTGGASERALVDEALAAAARPERVVLGGLGVGYSLARVCAASAPRAITVVEVEPVVVDWHRRHLASSLGHPLRDARVSLEVDDLAAWLWRAGPLVDVVCLDVDNGPGWTVRQANEALYDDDGLGRWHDRLRPGGVLAVWSAHADEAFEARLRARFADVSVARTPVERGEDDLVYLAVRG